MARVDQPRPGDALGRLARFRRKYYWCLRRTGGCAVRAGRRDTDGPGRLVASLPYRSLEAAFRRGIIYQALSQGGDRRGAVAGPAGRGATARLAPPVRTRRLDVPQAEAECSPGRGVSSSFLPGQSRQRGHGGRGVGVPVADPGQLRARLVDLAAGSGPRRGPGWPRPCRAAVQILAHSARLRAAGDDGIPLYVLDADMTRPLTWDLRDHLGRVRVLGSWLVEFEQIPSRHGRLADLGAAIDPRCR